MSIQLGQTAFDFKQDSTHGLIHFYDWLGSNWAVLFGHPAKSTSAYAIELREVAKLRREWNRRGVKPIWLSVYPAEAPQEWESEGTQSQGGTLDFPIIADREAKISTLYGVIGHERDPTETVRSAFVIDPMKKVRLIFAYRPSAAGRDFAELLGKIDNLQMADAFDPVI